MRHIQTVSRQPIEVEQINLSEKDINQIYRDLGINAFVQPQNRPFKRQSKAQNPYVRTIPLSWIYQASRLPGKALHVGIVIWFLSGVKKSKTVKLTRKWLSKFGIHPETGRRGLKALKRAELVHFEPSGHKSPLVTLVEHQSLRK